MRPRKARMKRKMRSGLRPDPRPTLWLVAEQEGLVMTGLARFLVVVVVVVMKKGPLFS